jgi:hypothetical protein
LGSEESENTLNREKRRMVICKDPDDHEEIVTPSSRIDRKKWKNQGGSLFPERKRL